MAPTRIIDRIRRITRDGRWIPEIDGLRFVAIVSVVLFHFAGEVSKRSGRVIPVEPRYAGLFAMIDNGDRGVRLFFVISGMILAMPFARQYLTGDKRVSLRKYYLRRVTRLEPPYLLSVGLFALVAAVYAQGRVGAGFGGHALASAFYVHNLVFGSISPLNPVTWSLEVEIQFYVLAPLVMQVFRIRGRWRRRAMMLGGIVAMGVAQAPFRGDARFTISILFYLQYFLAGLLVADVFVLDLAEIKTSWMWDAAGAAGLAVMYGAAHDAYWPHVALPLALGVVCVAAMRSVVLRRLVANPWVAVVGGMCYSIYLTHFVVMAAVFKVTRRLIVGRLDFLANYVIQLLAMGVPVLVLAFVYYTVIERPCMDPDWPSKLWHRVTGRSGDEVLALDTAGVGEGPG